MARGRGNQRSHHYPNKGNEATWIGYKATQILMTPHPVGVIPLGLLPTCLVDVGDDVSDYNGLEE